MTADIVVLVHEQHEQPGVIQKRSNLVLSELTRLKVEVVLWSQMRCPNRGSVEELAA